MYWKEQLESSCYILHVSLIVTVFSTKPDPVCYGDNVTITCESDGGIIVWVFNTGTISHIINTTETIPSINATIVTIKEAASTIIQSTLTLKQVQQDLVIRCFDDVNLLIIHVEGIQSLL